MRKLAISGIATLVAAAAFASTAAAELTKPGPGLLGPPILKPTLTSPAPVGTQSLTTKPEPIRIPAF